MTIRDYCFDHSCNMGECLFRNICPFYMYGGIQPSDLSYEEVKEITKDIIELGKVLQEDNKDE